MSNKNYLGAKQNKTHKISGRKQQDFEKAEHDYQLAQARWCINEDNKEAWDTMWILMQTAVFNSLNKDLGDKLDKEEIEERALDITMNIMRSIKNKRAAGKSWMIKKVSSFVHLPCLAKYDKKLQFYDKCLSEDAYTCIDDEGKQMIYDSAESEVIDGVLCLSGIYVIPDFMEKSGVSKIDKENRYDLIKTESEGQ